MRTFPDTAAPDPHDYATARRRAEQERSEAIDDFWRGAPWLEGAQPCHS